MFYVGYGIVRGSGAPVCIFHNKHKTLYNLFSPDPGVSCVGSHPEMYTLCSILLHFVKKCLISSLAMNAFTWDKWILLTAFL